jgi:hypothetical protein
MSHIVIVKTKVRDPANLTAACARLNLPAPVQGTARLYSGEATGLIVTLPGWTYPVVIDRQTGEVRYDNFGERWGSQRALDRLLQSYAVEMCRLTARQKGYAVTEQQLPDGSVKLNILVEGS